MIDSWNAAKLNERINQVESKIQANDVIANPTGAATEDLTKVSIDGTIYDLTDSNIATQVFTDTWTPAGTNTTIGSDILLENTGIDYSKIISVTIVSNTTNAGGWVFLIEATRIRVCYRQYAGIGEASISSRVIVTYRK